MQNHEYPLASEATIHNTALPTSTDKAPYWAPQLISHGQLEQVTQAGSDPGGEGGPGF